MTEPSKHIWYGSIPDPEQLNNLSRGTMGEWLDIRFTQSGPDFLKATMPVDHRTCQPYGLLHGGASVVLAETLGSVASAMVADSSRFKCVGMEINANHLRSAKQGLVTGIAKPLHLGATTHVWDIRIHDERDRLLCVSRLTVAVLKL